MELIGTKIAGVAKIENDLQIYIWEIRWNEALMSIPKTMKPWFAKLATWKYDWRNIGSLANLKFRNHDMQNYWKVLQTAICKRKCEKSVRKTF